MEDFDNLLETLKQLVSSQSKQNWLFGAGISYDAKIPLMYPLTDRVDTIIEADAEQTEKTILENLKADLSEKSHVEHYLSHLGDLIAIAERSKDNVANIGGVSYQLDNLNKLYIEMIGAIGSTVRYGYVKASEDGNTPEEIGDLNKPIVEISSHVEFVNALIDSQANLERRSRTTFFTTNYDTLLEDALALNKKVVCDGFSGGAVGFWNPEYEFNESTNKSNSYSLYKLHGSIDWHRDEDVGLVRARYGTKYLSDTANIMIYPQATKYVETQKDPFASLFAGLRKTLMESNQNVLITCGYSFGDEHINAEIESALKSDGNKTTLIAFILEAPVVEEEIVINKTLDRWLENSMFNPRVFVAGENGIYNKTTVPLAERDNQVFDWWSFSGLTKFIKTDEVL